MENFKLSRRFSATLMIVVVCLLVLIPSVSAFEFDNVKSYDTVTREVTITNAYGLGADIGKAKLNTPLNVLVGAGYQKVAEFDLWAYQDYSDALKQLTFSDMNNGKAKINRDYDLKYLTYKDVKVDDYETECFYYSSNSTNDTQVCNNIIVGNHIETRQVWNKVNPADLKKNERLTIGVFTEVQVGDYVDWIPTIYGVEIEEWATWTESLNVNLISYYKLDDNASNTNVNDSINTNEGTLSGGDNTENKSIAGKINNALNLDGSSDYIGVGGDTSLNLDDAPISISAWIKQDTYARGGQDNSIFLSAECNGYAFYSDKTGATLSFGKRCSNEISSTDTIADTDWHHVVVVYSADDKVTFYIDGSADSGGSISYTGTFDTSKNYAIGGIAGEGWHDGIIDEVAIWNRTLSESEVSQLYNSGDGITYIDTSKTSPNITLNSPTEDANYTTPQNIQFNFTAWDNINLTDVKLYVNGILNQTNASGINNTNYLFDLILNDGNYTILGMATDNDSLSTNSSSVQINIDTTPNIQYTANTRIDNYNSSSSYIPIEVTLTETYFDTISFNVNGTVTNYTNGTRLFNTTYVDGTYTYNVTVYTTTGQSNVTATRTINIDTTLPVVNLTYPLSQTNYEGASPLNLSLNWTLSDTNLRYCWYNYNGTNTTISSNCTQNSTSINLTQGYYNITLWANDSVGNTASSTATNVSINNLAPTISITNPTTSMSQGTISNNETLNVTVTDTENLDSCWYDYNGTNISIDGCVSGILNSTNFILEENNYNLTVYANDTSGNVNSSFISWIYNLTEVSQTYPNTSIESATETYTSTLTYNNSKYNIIAGSLHLNGSSYTGTRTGSGTSAIFTTSATMPSIETETNFTAYWTVSLTNEDGTTSYNLTSHNVTVSPINFTLCDAANNIAFWNFTILNESNAVEINSTFEGTFTVRLGSSAIENVFSYSDIAEDQSSYDFCISPGTESYTIDTNIKLTKSGFVNKFYDYGSVVVTNSTREDNLYMMATADSTSFIVHTIYTSGVDITDAEVKVQRYYPGTNEWLTTEILTTNDEGEAVGHFLSEDADYRFQVYLAGVSIYNSSATKIVCATAPCTVTLVIPTTLLTGYETYEDLETTLTYSTTTNIFTYTYEDTSSTFTNARLLVKRISPSNATIISPCNQTKTTASGVITCDITGGVNGTYMAVGYITRDDEFVTEIIYGSYGATFYDSIGDDGILWGIFIIIGVAMLGIARPSLAIIFSIVSLIIVSLLGLINVGVVSIVAVASIGIILLMRVGRE